MFVEKANVFGSAMAPFKLVFRTDTGGEYTVSQSVSVRLVSVRLPLTSSSRLHKIIFKCGDDPRQDQLVIQLISLMDSLLKKVLMSI